MIQCHMRIMQIEKVKVKVKDPHSDQLVPS